MDEIIIAVGATILIQIFAVLGGWKYIKAELNATTERSLENKESIVALLAAEKHLAKAEADYREEERRLEEERFRAIQQDIKGLYKKMEAIEQRLTLYKP